MVEIADAELPVFPFRVNWRGGIAERLEWATNVHAGVTGNEQRQAIRLTPRREFEVTITLWGEERQFFDLWLHRMAGGECLVPLWHDSVRATAEAVQGDSEVRVDTRGLEWEIGSYGLLRGLTSLSNEVIEIAGVEDDRLLLAAPIAGNWPKGTRVEPLRRGRMADNTKPRIVTDRVWECQTLIELTREQPYDDTMTGFDVYAGHLVFHKPPNRAASLDTEFAWDFNEIDNITGRRYRKTDSDRAFTRQKHEWLLHGRSAKAEFRRFLYYMRGRQRTIWLPTYSDDLTLSRDAGAAATSIYVKAIGFAYTGGPTSGREHICIQLRNRTRLYRRITGTAASGSAAEERLTLDTPLPAGLRRADVARISWMDTARFDADRLEFNHVNAADGASTVSATFRTFRDKRTVPAILSAPIPAAQKLDGRCGADDDPCVQLPEDLPDWEWRYIFQAYRSGPFGYAGIGRMSGYGGYHEFESWDEAAQRWSFLWYQSDWDPIVPPGTPVGWMFSFGFGSDRGTTCTRTAPGYTSCLGEVYLQHKTWRQPRLVASGPQFFVGPQEFNWIMPQP